MYNLLRKIFAVFLFVLISVSFFGCSKNEDSKGVNNKIDASKLNCLIDLHIHLDGAISVDSAKKLAKLQNISIPENDEELKKIMTVSPDCKDLNEFLEKFSFPCSLIQTKEGIKKSVENLLKELESEGLIYAEIRFAPQKSKEKGLTQEEVVLSAIEGLKSSKIGANLILCCMREKDNQKENIETVELANKYLGKGVCAVDLAGAEALFPTKDFKYIFDLARERGVPFTIHAGEADGPESVQTALNFGAKRIGHGVRSYEKEELIRTLASKNIPLELCPTSNFKTCIFEDISKYPIWKFLSFGVPVTINTDDPGIEGTTLKKEWQLLIDAFDLKKEEVKNILLNSVKYSFASEDVKESLKNKIEENFKNI